MPFASFVLIATLLAQSPFRPAGAQEPLPQQMPQRSAKPPQSIVSALIDIGAASRQGLMILAPPRAFSADWFARRYSVAPPALDSTRIGNPAGWVDIYALQPRAANDAARLWAGLETDLAPNQALVDKRGVIGLVISPDSSLRRQIVTLIKPTREAPAQSDLEWLASEMPHEIAGLTYVYARFLTPLPELEGRANGVKVRAVYQASYGLPRSSGPRGLAQADLWAPRHPAEARQLVRALDERKTSEQTIMSGKGVTVVVSTRTNQATKILVDYLAQKGYTLESRVATFK